MYQQAESFRSNAQTLWACVKGSSLLVPRYGNNYRDFGGPPPSLCNNMVAPARTLRGNTQGSLFPSTCSKWFLLYFGPKIRMVLDGFEKALRRFAKCLRSGRYALTLRTMRGTRGYRQVHEGRSKPKQQKAGPLKNPLSRNAHRARV